MPPATSLVSHLISLSETEHSRNTVCSGIVKDVAVDSFV